MYLTRLKSYRINSVLKKLITYMINDHITGGVNLKLLYFLQKSYLLIYF